MIYLNLLNRIFGRKAPLTREEIDLLKEEASNFPIENKEQSDVFNQEAMEGWSSIEGDVNSTMKRIDQTVSQELKTNTGSTKTPVFVFLTLFTVIMILLIVYTYRGNQLQEAPVRVELDPIANDKGGTTARTEDKSAEKAKIQLAEIETYEPIEKSEQITKDQLRVEDKESYEKENELNEDMAQLSPKTSEEIPTPSTNKLIFNQVTEQYLHGLKTVDYRNLRQHKEIELIQDLPTGVPANMANADEEMDEITEVKKNINYLEYLEETQLFFVEESYKRALRRYLIILDHFPDDVNAHFYSGLCYYNLGKYDKAIHHFKKSYSVNIGNFKEESEWFEARALISSDKKQQAKELIIKIKKEGGFYSEQAADLLDSL